MSDNPEERARRKEVFAELVRLSEEAGFYENEATPEEIIATIKQVRKELAEQRNKDNGINISAEHE